MQPIVTLTTVTIFPPSLGDPDHDNGAGVRADVPVHAGGQVLPRQDLTQGRRRGATTALRGRGGPGKGLKMWRLDVKFNFSCQNT